MFVWDWSAGLLQWLARQVARKFKPNPSSASGFLLRRVFCHRSFPQFQLFLKDFIAAAVTRGWTPSKENEHYCQLFLVLSATEQTESNNKAGLVFICI